MRHSQSALITVPCLVSVLHTLHRAQSLQSTSLFMSVQTRHLPSSPRRFTHSQLEPISLPSSKHHLPYQKNHPCLPHPVFLFSCPGLLHPPAQQPPLGSLSTPRVITAVRPSASPFSQVALWEPSHSGAQEKRPGLPEVATCYLYVFQWPLVPGVRHFPGTTSLRISMSKAA